MTTRVRILLAAVVLCLAASAAAAQLPVAPAPHPTLDELAKEYRRCGLPVPPKDKEPAALKGVSGAADWLCRAAQFKLMGSDDRAAATYAKGRAELADGVQQASVESLLRHVAWAYWQAQLIEPRSDRKEALARLRYLVAALQWELTEGTKNLFSDLELTVAPRKSKPGSVEALIDELTDYWDEGGDSYDETGHGAYWKLVERGFDAVPALLEHVKDRRLTRAELLEFTGIRKHNLQVGYLVELILDGLSGGKYDFEMYSVQSKDWVPPKDHKWWKEAQKVGEERWLVDNALPPPHMGYEPDAPNKIILHLIRVKYPNRLGDVYRTLLTKRPKIQSEMITREIVASKLPLARKLALLKEGLAFEEGWHRDHALNATCMLVGVAIVGRVLPSWPFP